MTETFSNFVLQKAKTKHITCTSMAKDLGVSVVYVSDICHGKRPPPKQEMLGVMAKSLKLSSDEKEQMYDLAGLARNNVSCDIASYIMSDNCRHLRRALRRAEEKKLNDDFWKTIAQRIEEL
jgi:transcriptional regulator with XRE-family HTH domain